MRLVYVEWLDSYGCSASWQHLSAGKAAPMVCRSVGWLLHDTNDCKVVVPHVSDADRNDLEAQGCGDMTIPTAAIVRLVTLKIPTRPSRRR